MNAVRLNFELPGDTPVAQVSKPAVSPTSKSAGRAAKWGHREFSTAAGLETCDTAGLEACATGDGRAPVARFGVKTWVAKSPIAAVSEPLSVIAKVRAHFTATSGSLSSVRNGGEGRGEEALRHGETVRNGGTPLSPSLAPFVPHGAREPDALLGTAVPARAFATTDSYQSLIRNYSVRATGARPLGRRNVRPAWRKRIFHTAFLDSPSGEPRCPMGLFGAVAAGGRFCGLKAALLSR